MPFVKQNLISIIAVAIAVIGIPVMVYFSSGWSADNRTTLEDGVTKVMRELNGATVNYEVPVPGPDGRPWSLNTAPSQRKNQRLEQMLDQLVARSSAVRDEIISMNSDGKSLLVDGDPRYGDLFPAPASESARVALLTRMMEAYPAAHDALLESAGVRDTLSADAVRSQVEAQRARRVASITSQRVEQTLSAEEIDSVRRFLGEYRASLYEAHAGETVMFGTPGVFRGLERLDPEAGDEIVSLEKAWEWQHRTWFNQDLVAALVKANSASDGERLSVLNAPVKRIVSIAIDPVPAPAAAGFGADDGGGGGAVAGSLSAPIAPDYSANHTGLNAWPERPNPLYDLRTATVQLLVDGDRIAEVVEAISTTNLMSVIDLDFREFDPGADLARGYDYGDAQTVALTLRVQSAWIRAWMKTDMPASVRTQLGIPADPAPTEDGANTADAA